MATHSTTKVVKIEKEKNNCCTAEHCITSWAGCSQFTTRIPSKLAYIRHSDQNSCTPPHNYSRIQAKQEWPKVTLCQQETDSTTINCKLKQPTTWVQKTQNTLPQHQQILSNKYRVLPLFMWQWSADASRGVAYHIHLVQQVIVLILSMACSGAFYLCIQAKMTWLSDASSSQPKSIGIISNGYLPNRKNNFTQCVFFQCICYHS